MMGDHAQHEHVVLGKLDERTVSAVLQNVLVERCLHHRSAVHEHPRVAAAWKAVQRLERQILRAGDARELVVGIERAIRQLICTLVEQICRTRRLILAAKLLAHGLIGLQLARSDLVQTNDVKSKLALHGRAHFPDLHGEQRVLERARQHPATDPAELTALGLRAHVIRDLVRNCGKVLASAQPLGDAFRLRPRGFDVLADIDQNVARAPFLLGLKPLALLVVEARRPSSVTSIVAAMSLCASSTYSRSTVSTV